MDLELCIKCDRGGMLLVCSDSGCPIAVHEKCMGCPARYDEGGLFYCPYCLCRKTVAEVCRARENAMSKKKALSIFIDDEMIGGAKQVEKDERAEVEKQNGNLSRGNCSRNNNNTDVVYDHSIQLEEEQRAKRSSHECSPSPSKIVDAPTHDNQNDDLAVSSESHKGGAQMKDCTEVQETPILPRREPYDVERQEKRISYGVEEKMQKELLRTSAAPSGEVPLVQARSRAKREVKTKDATCRESEIILRRSKRVKKSDMNKEVSFSRSKGANTSRLLHQDDVLTGTSGVRKGDACMNDDPEEQGNVIPSRTAPDKLEMQEEQKSSSVEEEKAQDKEQEMSATSSDGVPLVRARARSKRVIEDNKSIDILSEDVLTGNKDFKHNDTSKRQSRGVDSPRRSSWRSFSDVEINDVQNGKVDGSRRSGPHEQRIVKLRKDRLLKGRRKRLLWTEEEEEMLREGVKIFSSEANVNMPWRKVLEFGRHVFHPTRTPIDLKDKWRNLI